MRSLGGCVSISGDTDLLGDMESSFVGGEGYLDRDGCCIADFECLLGDSGDSSGDRDRFGESEFFRLTGEGETDFGEGEYLLAGDRLLGERDLLLGEKERFE